MEFILTQHKFHILTGSKDGSTNGRKMPLVCHRCGKSLLPTGYAVCKTEGCWQQIDLSKMQEEGLINIGVCPHCNKSWMFEPKEIVWTTTIVSRHRKNKYVYYGKDCWSSLFVDPKHSGDNND